MRIVLVLTITFTVCLNLLSQDLIFPTVGDGSQSYKAEFVYLDFVTLNVSADSIGSLKTNNGYITKKGNLINYNHTIFPDMTGQLEVELVSFTDGKIDTTRSEILVVNRPNLKLVVHQQGDSIKLNLLDEKEKIVTENFNCAIEAEIKVNDKKFNYMISSWKKWINIQSYFELSKMPNSEEIIISFNTTAVYSKKYDLFTGNYECSIKIK